MNLEALHRKLIAAARANPPSAAVPYAFEQRILARLRDRPGADAWLVWGQTLWRAAAACIVMAVAVSALSFAAGGGEVMASAEEDFESTVFAAADVLSDSW
jgi:hypothetical protein